MNTARPDLGDRVSGVVLDHALWDGSSRIRRLRPAQTATGLVTVLYPNAPRVVGIRRPDDVFALILIGRRL